jgi:hypothetical protein
LEDLNAQLEQRLQKLEQCLDESEAKIKANCDMALIHQFGINLEYEIKDLFIYRGIERKWGYSCLMNTDLEEIGILINPILLVLIYFRGTTC